MKKRMIAFLVIAVFALTMIGCGNETQEPVDAPDTITESVVPEETPVIDDVVQEPEVTVQPTDEPEADVVPEEIPTEDATTAEDTVEVPAEETVDETPTSEDTTIDEEPTVIETPETEEPETEANLEELRAEELNYDFEGVYWMDESGYVYYFDGTYQHSYYTFDRDYDGAPDVSKDEYIATDRTYEYVGEGYGFRWYIYEDTFGFWLDGGEMGGDSGAMETTYTAISKEKAIELFPKIGKSETQPTPTQTPIIEEPEVTETPEVEEPTTDDTNEVAEATCDFEGKYWLNSYGMSCKYYSDGKAVTWYSDGDIRSDDYVVDGNVITFGDYEYKFWIEDGKLYLEPLFTDGFGGETMVYTEITKNELNSMFDITE